MSFLVYLLLSPNARAHYKKMVRLEIDFPPSYSGNLRITATFLSPHFMTAQLLL